MRLVRQITTGGNSIGHSAPELLEAVAILAEAALSYLGLGTQPPTPSWGSMLSQGREWIDRAPWLTIFPGMAIFVTVLALNVIGDGLRDALDPRLRL